jgi:hypothetical protein
MEPSNLRRGKSGFTDIRRRNKSSGKEVLALEGHSNFKSKKDS